MCQDAEAEVIFVGHPQQPEVVAAGALLHWANHGFHQTDNGVCESNRRRQFCGRSPKAEAAVTF